MVNSVEKSGNFLNGIEKISLHYQKKIQRAEELQKLLRYPKIIVGTVLLLIFGIVILIVPMFKNIYSLYGDDLPVATKVLINVSDLFQQYGFQICLIGICLGLFFTVPLLKTINPLLLFYQKVKDKVITFEDPFLYVESIRLFLENGITLSTAAEEAALSMSKKNRKYGFRIIQQLEKGMSLTSAFSSEKWFPACFPRFLSSTEKAGKIVVGFQQIESFLEQKREDRFNRWSKLIEPVTMILLGVSILGIMLSVYLPIFDLGNRIG